jgi:hypothetical protein
MPINIVYTHHLHNSQSVISSQAKSTAADGGPLKGDEDRLKLPRERSKWMCSGIEPTVMARKIRPPFSDFASSMKVPNTYTIDVLIPRNLQVESVESPQILPIFQMIPEREWYVPSKANT